MNDELQVMPIAKAGKANSSDERILGGCLYRVNTINQSFYYFPVLTLCGVAAKLKQNQSLGLAF
ncbi:hypothetical protein [Noviherbaspirillum galbum]|uniref:Uncharacterized protein n=1 Tax=Noviherbaspirillum galbum TaxID=2709383 RepID=A0A6B3SHV2_9BURK|nr:hypothetical protein [Noviherbaspirillum galbum]NEX60240.1 hypothetical protein [Noviherbaspirillum galbum]